LRFVFLEITREASLARVAGRGASHFFPTNLVDSQFATLESPVGEAGVLSVDATAPLAQLQAQVSRWLHTSDPT
jgi:gluconokinase